MLLLAFHNTLNANSYSLVGGFLRYEQINRQREICKMVFLLATCILTYICVGNYNSVHLWTHMLVKWHSFNIWSCSESPLWYKDQHPYSGAGPWRAYPSTEGQRQSCACHLSPSQPTFNNCSETKTPVLTESVDAVDSGPHLSHWEWQIPSGGRLGCTFLLVSRGADSLDSLPVPGS